MEILKPWKITPIYFKEILIFFKYIDDYRWWDKRARILAQWSKKRECCFCVCAEKSDSSIKECAPINEPIDDENDIDKEFANFTIEKIDEELKKCREMQKKLLRAKKRKMTGKKRSFKK